jgi:hypothetical protein
MIWHKAHSSPVSPLLTCSLHKRKIIWPCIVSWISWRQYPCCCWLSVAPPLLRFRMTSRQHHGHEKLLLVGRQTPLMLQHPHPVALSAWAVAPYLSTPVGKNESLRKIVWNGAYWLEHPLSRRGNPTRTTAITTRSNQPTLPKKNDGHHHGILLLEWKISNTYTITIDIIH